MIAENPEVTLKEDGHGIPRGAREAGMTLWDSVADVQGDDGRRYWIDTSMGNLRRLGGWGAVSWGSMDMWSMGISWETGKVIQPPGSAFKIADFPQTTAMSWYAQPSGALRIRRSKHQVKVDLGDCHITCRDDMTWHFDIEDKAKGIKAEWVHYGKGFPHWYGKEKPQEYTPHVSAFGYLWPGLIEGELTIEGRKVGIKGKCARERYYALDACSAEVGGWHDWMWLHFDEMFGVVHEMKLTKHKDMTLYLVDEKRYLPSGDFNIEHFDWAYLRSLGAFVPTLYKVTIETEAGILEMTAKVVGCQLFGATGEVPDAPNAMLHWDKFEGTFTYKDGRKRKLTNGLGGTAIRQWRPYPNVYEWLTQDRIGTAEAKNFQSMPKLG